MASPVPSGTLEIDDEIQMERNAGLIMGTNNSSIMSKRSVEKLYLPRPHFYKYFVKKSQRRSPTINRGYWLRMRAVDWVVRQFLEKPSDYSKVVLNLGCGYDPLPFQWMAREPELCRNTKFIDIDYEELMATKTAIIQNIARMSEMLSNTMGGRAGLEKSILLDSPEYAAIGCDLRNIPRLNRLLHEVIDVDQCHVLCIAEVSVTYMPTDAADALIAWTSRLSSDVTFCLLEQGSPDRPDNPFTSTMVKHFEKLGTPLRSIFEYPGEHTQFQRFQKAGFTNTKTQNLWELWSDPRFLSPSQRMALDGVEPFDEWEEFSLFASHYLLVIAHSGPSPDLPTTVRTRRGSIDSIISDISARTASPYRAETQWFALKHFETDKEETRRHHGSAYHVPDQDAIAVHGGVGPQGRLNNTPVFRRKDFKAISPTVLSLEVGKRCCHTITTLTNGQNLFVGGRGSPTQAMKDCWLQTGTRWTRVHDLPEPRYRHRAVRVELPGGVHGAVVFGGKTDASTVSADTLLWHPQTGWQVLRTIGSDPVPRFGASFVFIGYNHGLLFGGMRQDGVICQGMWRWRLIIRDHEVKGISFRSSSALDASVGAYPWLARMGASCGNLRDEMLIIGGIARSGCIPKLYEIMSFIGSFSAFNEYEKEMSFRLSCVEPTVEADMRRPFLVGHSTHRTKSGTLVITGGGATCFSFGNYYNTGAWVLFYRDLGLEADWGLVDTTANDIHPSVGQVKQGHSAEDPAVRSTKPGPARQNRYVQQQVITTTEQLVRQIQSSHPCIMRSLSLGSCLQSWSPSYLQSRISPARKVVIHESSTSRMNFQRKDFSYRTLLFADFTKQLLSPHSHIYLRALAADNPSTARANFEEDFPELVNDFKLPSPLSGVLSEAKHSSCLRISNDITMWLHYDVMANVLFQIHGVKKLILFPPADIKHLCFPPGSTTSELDIFGSSPSSLISKTTEGFRQEVSVNAPPGTTPYAAVLRPGDALFIPPLWPHTGISLPHESSVATNSRSSPPSPNLSFAFGRAESIDSEASQKPEIQNDAEVKGKSQLNTEYEHKNEIRVETGNKYTNIAINIFFRSLPSNKYAAGRDVYGNRDLAAYEDGRRDIDRIVSRFVRGGGKAGKAKKAVNGSRKMTTQSRKNGSRSNGQQVDTGSRQDRDESDKTDEGSHRQISMLEPVAATATAGARTDHNTEPVPEDDNNQEEDGNEKITSFQDGLLDSIPREMTKAYLERLADELRARASEL